MLRGAGESGNAARQETGLLVEPEDILELRDKLRMLIHDTMLRERLAASAKQFAQTHFTRERMARQIANIYLSEINF